MSVAVFDLDGTLLRQNSSFSFCCFLYKRHLLTLKDLVFCTFVYSRHLFFRLDLESLHQQVFNRLFRGKSVSILAEPIQAFIGALKWNESVLSRLNQLRKQGTTIYIFSNSPLILVQPIARTIGVENVIATDYQIDSDGLLCNIGLFVDGKKKGELLRNFEHETIAFSDSHHDLPFLESASVSIVVNPTRRLYKIALKRNWEVL